MRKLLLVLLPAVSFLSGCAKPAAPLTAHGQPVAHWVEELKRPEAKARKKAVRALGHVGKADPAALPAVVAALKDRDAAVRQEAALALLNLGPDAADAVGALAEAQKDADAKVRAYAARALERVQGAK